MTPPENHLIRRLPARERQALLALAEPVALRLSAVLVEADAPSPDLYLPLSGFVSLIIPVDQHPGLEVGMVGWEGMLGLHRLLGHSRSPLRVVVQGAGQALRLPWASFQPLLQASPGLQDTLRRYLGNHLDQLARAVACQRFHTIAPRLARWLLMSQDRARSSEIQVTHAFLAYMLGVRRVGITLAAQRLQLAGLIDYRRGVLGVLDRRGLEDAACNCYRADRLRYAEVLGEPGG